MSLAILVDQRCEPQSTSGLSESEQYVKLMSRTSPSPVVNHGSSTLTELYPAAFHVVDETEAVKDRHAD